MCVRELTMLQVTSQFNFQPLNNPETGIQRYRLLVVILESETETDKNRLPVSKWSLGIWSGSKIRDNEAVEILCDFDFFQCAQDGFILSFIFFNGNVMWHNLGHVSLGHFGLMSIFGIRVVAKFSCKDRGVGKWS